MLVGEGVGHLRRIGQPLVQGDLERVQRIVGEDEGRGGVGLFLFGRAIRAVNEYRQIDYLTDGKTVRKVIYVPGKLLNIVAT